VIDPDKCPLTQVKRLEILRQENEFTYERLSNKEDYDLDHNEQSTSLLACQAT